MADLGTILLGTFDAVNSTNTAITGTEPVLQAIAAAEHSTHVHDTSNTSHTGLAVFALGDMPSDFGNIDTVAINLRYAWESGAQTNTWTSLTAQIVRSDLSTALTDEVTIASSITTSTPTTSGAITLTNPDTAAHKAVWDAAVVMLRFNITKNKGGDSLEERVFAAEVTGTYTIDTGATGTAAPQVSTPELSASGGQTFLGTADLEAAQAEVSTTGVADPVGAGVLEAAQPTLAAAGEQPHEGIGALDALTPTMTASGTHTAAAGPIVPIVPIAAPLYYFTLERR